MHQIVPYDLWIGHAGEERDFRKVFSAGIKALVELAMEEPPSQPPRELVYCRFPLLDGAGNDAELIHMAISTVATLLRNKMPTLVACGIGLSRSPAIAAAALAVLQRQSFDECLKRVAEHLPRDVSPALWGEIKAVLASGQF